MNKTKPISVDVVKCCKCKNNVEVCQYDSTENPSGQCKNCGEHNYAFYNTQTWKVESC